MDYKDQVAIYVKKRKSDSILWDASLLEELLEYGLPLNSKAWRVYFRCLRMNHFVIAERIKQKHRLEHPKYDLTIATAYCQLAQEKKK